MFKTPARHNKRAHRDEYDLHGDLARIKEALAEATFDAKGKAREVFNQSLDEVRERSEAVQENVGAYIADKPFKTIGVALLAGWVLGYFMHK